MIHLTEAEYLEEYESGGGYCTECQQPATNHVEPDARNYLCESCGKKTVFGTPELLIMGLISIVEDEE